MKKANLLEYVMIQKKEGEEKECFDQIEKEEEVRVFYK